MTLRTVLFPACVLSIISPFTDLLATQRYVAHPPRGNDSNPGTKAFPFATIQRGIDASSGGDSVIVNPGTYVENIHFDGKNIVVTSTDPLDPDFVANTIIDGNKKGSVVTFSGTETEACRLSGFTIRNGANVDYGGGIYGGRLDVATQATIQNNTITSNSAAYGGGLSNCDGIIRNNTISGNSVYVDGGGLDGCDGAVQNNVIAANAADFGGGLYMCNGRIQHNTVLGNFASHNGGGLYGCNGTIRSNLIVGNLAPMVFSSGGGMSDCDGSVENNTVVQNEAWTGGGLSKCDGVIRNCVIWANTADSGPQLHSGSTPTYSCIQGWGGGQGNTSLDPVFVDPDGADNDPNTYYDNNYRLQQTSPCIDAGDNEGLNPPGFDFDGNLRIVFGEHSVTVDMGAYEYNSGTIQIQAVLGLGASIVHIIWRSQPNDAYTVWSRPDFPTGTWIEEATVFSQGAETPWTDIAASGQMKFYRVEMK